MMSDMDLAYPELPDPANQTRPDAAAPGTQQQDERDEVLAFAADIERSEP
jgi:hypothetical protein